MNRRVGAVIAALVVLVVAGAVGWLLVTAEPGAGVADPGTMGTATSPRAVAQRSTSTQNARGTLVHDVPPATDEGPVGADGRGSAAALEPSLVLRGGDVMVPIPPSFALAVAQDQLLDSSQVPPCDPGFDYCLYLTDSYQGTNFSSAGVRIDVRDDLTNQADCLLEQPGGHSDLTPAIEGAPGFATSRYDDVQQGAAGHVSRGQVARLFFRRVCYEFETRVAQSQFGTYQAGTITEFTAGDRADVERLLEDVLAAVALPDGRADLWSQRQRGGSG